MTFLDHAAPWGSPVVPSIPLPPFAGEDDHRRFVRLLQLHLALLDQGDPSLPTIALSAALDRRAYGTAEFTQLTPVELSVSLTTWFPAPWTLDALAAALAVQQRDAPTRSGSSWRWLYDPEFTATADGRGGWEVIRFERGSKSSATLASDRDLVVLWLAHFRQQFAIPIGHKYEPTDVAALAPATLAVAHADARDAAYPYRRSWRTERAAALAAADRLSTDPHEG